MILKVSEDFIVHWFWLLQIGFAEVPKTIPLPHIRGKELYDELCFHCHGVLGIGDSALAKSVNAPALAGRIDESKYKENIELIQQGIGLMPSYEMVIDKHDTKRILIYLSGLDPETGIDPRIKEEKEETEESKAKRCKFSKGY